MQRQKIKKLSLHFILHLNLNLRHIFVSRARKTQTFLVLNIYKSLYITLLAFRYIISDQPQPHPSENALTRFGEKRGAINKETDVRTGICAQVAGRL